jgi:hypothetical protein
MVSGDAMASPGLGLKITGGATPGVGLERSVGDATGGTGVGVARVGLGATGVGVGRMTDGGATGVGATTTGGGGLTTNVHVVEASFPARSATTTCTRWGPADRGAGGTYDTDDAPTDARRSSRPSSHRRTLSVLIPAGPRSAKPAMIVGCTDVTVEFGSGCALVKAGGRPSMTTTPMARLVSTPPMRSRTTTWARTASPGRTV